MVATTQRQKVTKQRLFGNLSATNGRPIATDRPKFVTSLSQELSGDADPQYFLKSTATQMGGVLLCFPVFKA